MFASLAPYTFLAHAITNKCLMPIYLLHGVIRFKALILQMCVYLLSENKVKHMYKCLQCGLYF